MLTSCQTLEFAATVTYTATHALVDVNHTDFILTSYMMDE